MTNNATIQDISLAIYDAICSAHQHQPDFLQEKYRLQPWGNKLHKAAFAEKLGARLSSTSDSTKLLEQVDSVLRALICQDQIQSTNFRRFFEQIRLSIQSSSQANQHLESKSQEHSGTNSPESELQGAIAVLLLDAENLQPSLVVESFLTQACAYPLRVKVAFADWRKLGKYDVELHHRHYDLIHVPSGKDMADGKMIVFGSSLHERYPTAKEVLICSSDKVMSNLCTKLRQEGFTVLQVRKQNDEIIICNCETGSQANYSTASVLPLEKCIASLKSLIKHEQLKSECSWVKLSTVSKGFLDQHGVSLSKIISTHTPGKRARDLFVDYPQDFVIHQPSEETELFVSVFDDHTLARSTSSQVEQKSPPEPALPVEATPKQSPFKSQAALEQAIAEIVKTLTTQKPDSYVNISFVASQFKQRYQVPITTAIHQFQPKQKFPTFLKSCKRLVVEPIDKGWQVKCRA